MPRSELTIDLGALRRNVRGLLDVLKGAELWAVVKADAYGHGIDCGPVALEAGATALCVATLEEGLALRIELPEARIIVLGPVDDVGFAREHRLEITIADGRIPDGIPVHLKLDTGMGRWGLSELPEPPANVVGLMSHFAAADSDPGFTERQIERFREATEPYAHLTRHLANSAGALRFPGAHFDAVRCGIALYGLSPFADPLEGFEPVMRWESELAQVKLLRAGESTGYGRRFVAETETWIGIVPVGYADGFRRDMTGTTVIVGGHPAPVVGTISMDALAVVLPGSLLVGTPVTLVGPGAPLEAHARVAGTITYELACGIGHARRRALDFVDA